MQPTLSRLTLALILALSLPGLALAQAAGAKVATVNGVAIPKSRIDAVVRAQEGQGQGFAGNARRDPRPPDHP